MQNEPSSEVKDPRAEDKETGPIFSTTQGLEESKQPNDVVSGDVPTKQSRSFIGEIYLICCVSDLSNPDKIT